MIGQDAADRHRASGEEQRDGGEDVHQAHEADPNQTREVQEHEELDRHEIR